MLNAFAATLSSGKACKCLTSISGSVDGTKRLSVVKAYVCQVLVSRLDWTRDSPLQMPTLL